MRLTRKTIERRPAAPAAMKIRKSETPLPSQLRDGAPHPTASVVLRDPAPPRRRCGKHAGWGVLAGPLHETRPLSAAQTHHQSVSRGHRAPCQCQCCRRRPRQHWCPRIRVTQPRYRCGSGGLGERRPRLPSQTTPSAPIGLAPACPLDRALFAGSSLARRNIRLGSSCHVNGAEARHDTRQQPACQRISCRQYQRLDALVRSSDRGPIRGPGIRSLPVGSISRAAAASNQVPVFCPTAQRCQCGRLDRSSSMPTCLLHVGLEPSPGDRRKMLLFALGFLGQSARVRRSGEPSDAGFRRPSTVDRLTDS